MRFPHSARPPDPPSQLLRRAPPFDDPLHPSALRRPPLHESPAVDEYVRTPQFLQLHQPDDRALVAEAIAGLLQPQAQLSPKFFYDALGSHLFDAITALDEYYPTRTEAAIFAAHGDAIAAAAHRLPGGSATLVDLGAGNCAKAAGLFPALQPERYVAVDISVDYLRQALQQLQPRHPDVEMLGVGLDFGARLELPDGVLDGPALLFYPGSSIGNFTPTGASRLLRQAHAMAGGGGLLIGVDLIKAPDVLQPAYDDALGVTAAFNLNLLRHVNRLLDSDFDPRQWQHRGSFNGAHGRIEMHLLARDALTVQWPGGSRAFTAGERIHTENSYKWQRSDFEGLLRDAGFAQVQTWTDARGWFAVMLASG